ncbi:MAG: phosphopantothenate--cysteine ligase, partial [Euryarchaeota archaeon]|nr:phosphopantothenate--cysteine ligase [Euryarchaeota archaeon]
EKEEGKIPADKEELVLRLRKCPKVLASIRKKKCTLIGFKAESGINEEELARRARERLDQFGLDVIVANDLRKVSAETTEVLILTKKGKPKPAAGTKREVANLILDETLRVAK